MEQIVHPLAGVFEKLKRADENIVNFSREIEIFLEDGPAPIGDNDDHEAFFKAVDEHSGRAVPLRFSVLAGEIAHHLRTSLNHLAFQLTPEILRPTRLVNIEFPVAPNDPNRPGATKGELARYRSKIEGISPSATTLIHGLQPYMRPDPLNDPLLIVHDMDRTDKHRELALVTPAFNLHLRPEVIWEIERQANLGISVKVANMTMDSKFTTEVAFREFGQGQNQPVIPGLLQLAKYVRDVVLLFIGEFR